MPVFPPVTMMTLPLRSGMSFTVYFGFGMKYDCFHTCPNFHDMDSAILKKREKGV